MEEGEFSVSEETPILLPHSLVRRGSEGKIRHPVAPDAWISYMDNSYKIPQRLYNTT
jgi:hypothetical protein